VVVEVLPGEEVPAAPVVQQPPRVVAGRGVADQERVPVQDLTAELRPGDQVVGAALGGHACPITLRPSLGPWLTRPLTSILW
jgi:hypothetical protein